MYLPVIQRNALTLARACILSLGIVVAGCVSDADRDTGLDGADHFIELKRTPFYPQSKYQCGPASLATVLKAAGIDTEPDQLVNEVYLPARKGSLQIEMVAAVRRQARVPYDPGDSLQSIMVQLAHDHPVLVLLNLRIRAMPVYHYAVVIGYDPDQDELILRSGTDYRILMPRREFIAAWRKAGNWGLVVLYPGELPAGVDVDRYLSAIIALETIGQWRTAESSYRAVLDRWPGNTLAAFGLANSLRALGRSEEAITQYQYVLQLKVDHWPARNNLADTYLRLGRCNDARSALGLIERHDDLGPAVKEAIQETLSDIETNCPDSQQQPLPD
jgi:tetratricopeptide (TPR) repeat protein